MLCCCKCFYLSEADMIWLTWVYQKQTGEKQKSNRNVDIVLCLHTFYVRMQTENVYIALCFSRNYLRVFCFYMSLFACKCKSLNRLGENVKTTEITQKSFENNDKISRTTGYPALDPTANKYLSGSGWEIMILCFYFYFFFCKCVFFLFFLCFFFCFFFEACSFFWNVFICVFSIVNANA